MPRVDLDGQLERIDELIAETKKFVPASAIGAGQFRADLAGLLVVSIAATYESCVKDVLVAYAHRQHVNFGSYTSVQYAKLNSRVSVGDLHAYANTFDPGVGLKFKETLSKKRAALNLRAGRDIEVAYGQILRWRHAFAHSGARNTTIEEAETTHRFAKRVIYCFGSAFD